MSSSGLRSRKDARPKADVRSEAVVASAAAAAAAGTSASSSRSANGASIILSVLPQWIFILGLIFGGCCSNAYFLELSTAEMPDLGTLITFLHFFFTMLLALPSQIDLKAGRVKKNVVPMKRWAVQVVLYATTSLLNNVAFAYDVPMPVHIIFRSGGLVVNMIMGWLIRRRRYSLVQIVSVVLVTGGVILATLSTSPPPPPSSSPSSKLQRQTESKAQVSQYGVGIGLLFLALVLSSLMGIWQEITFSKYGKDNWQESIFYSHLLSLPLLGLRGKDLQREWAMARTSTTVYYPVLGVHLPSMLPLLALNVVTQLACINGVNRLTSRVSSVGVTLVLVVRKAVSLAISVLLVGGSRGADLRLLVLGAAAVFAGTVGYTWASSRSSSTRDRDSKSFKSQTKGNCPAKEQ